LDFRATRAIDKRRSLLVVQNSLLAPKNSLLAQKNSLLGSLLYSPLTRRRAEAFWPQARPAEAFDDRLNRHLFSALSDLSFLENRFLLVLQHRAFGDVR
jgi:hypothetical protein